MSAPNIHDRLFQLESLRNNGVVKGEATGFAELDKLYSIKQGTYTIIFAEPRHGKSEFIFEMILNQTRFDKRSLVCSPETGSYEEIIAELVHKYTGRSMIKSEYNALSDKEFYDAIAWLSEWFIVLDTDEKSYSVPELFEYAEKWEKENHKKIHIIVGEPFNELEHDMTPFSGRQDLYIEWMYGFIRRECRKTKKHFMISLHPAQSQSIMKNGRVYFPKPSPRNAAGGQASYRKAMTWITLWRPPTFILDDDGRDYKDNEVHVYIDKAKPKGVAFVGVMKLYFNWKKNRYFANQWGKDVYAFEEQETKTRNITEPNYNEQENVLTPNLNYDKEELF
jgi:hypothetical protein